MISAGIAPSRNSRMLPSRAETSVEGGGPDRDPQFRKVIGRSVDGKLARVSRASPGFVAGARPERFRLVEESAPPQ